MISPIAPERIARLLQDLVRRAVKAKKVAPPQVPKGNSFVGVYVTTDNRTAVACQVDLGLAANIGAALCLIPAYTAKESIKAQRLDTSLLENFREVLNVCGQLFKVPESPRVILQSVCETSQLSGGDAVKLISSPPSRLDLQLSIDGYGEGYMSIFS